MKIYYFVILVFLLTQRANGGVVRQRPAFAKPVYSNSYLPAAMQVIFHAVDQLKNLEADEAEQAVSVTTTSVPATSPHAPGQHQPTPEEIAMQSTDSTAFAGLTESIVSDASTVSIVSDTSTALIVSDASTASIISDDSTASISSDVSTASSAYEASTASLAYEASTLPEAATALSTSGSSTGVTLSEASTASIASILLTSSTALLMAAAEAEPTQQQATDEITEKNPEVAEETMAALEAETPENNYATPETNHEIQEPGQEMAETNQEMPEKIEEHREEEATSGVVRNGDAAEVSTTTEMKPREKEDDSSEEVDGEKSSEEESSEESDESKSLGSSESEQNERQSAEEEDDEIRFTLIGEKVSQVPRPSLVSYLRKTVKAPLKSSVQELAGLYDALSKDARKQGLAKFSGYSDEVLKTLESTMEGGVGPQLLVLLEKAVERNEVTRDDAKQKILNTLNELADPATTLSRDLRRLVPLRFVP